MRNSEGYSDPTAGEALARIMREDKMMKKMEQKIKPIETVYKGYRFRSRLEARWAVFFDACGVDWEYEPEGYDLGGGLYYLPDFLLHGLVGRVEGDLYVEVKGVMTKEDAEKIRRFAGEKLVGEYCAPERPVLVVGKIPDGSNMIDVDNYISEVGYDGMNNTGISQFNFETIDGDFFAAHPGVNKEGGFELFGDDSNYLCDRDDRKTERAYCIARQVRFESRKRRSARCGN